MKRIKSSKQFLKSVKKFHKLCGEIDDPILRSKIQRTCFMQRSYLQNEVLSAKRKFINYLKKEMGVD